MNEDIMLELYDYCSQKYNKEEMGKFLHDLHEEFPYHIEGIDQQNFIRNFMDWFVLEKVMPSGKRMPEEFVDDHPELDEEIKQKIINTKNIIVSKFVVISKDNLNLKIKDMKTGNKYGISLIAKNSQLQPNVIILGRIFPYGDIYRFAGSMLLQHTPMIVDPEIMMNAYENREIKETEKIVLSPSTKLAAVLNKYPANWVDGICRNLELSSRGKKNEKAKLIAEEVSSEISLILDKLSVKSKEALKLIMDNGGFVKYNTLKDYDDEMSFFWDKNPPNSTIGALRKYGLLVVGRMPFGQKMFKTAMIPKDVLEMLDGAEL